MENNLMIFEEREVLGRDFKMYGDKDNPLFLAKDVASWIEHSKVSMMLQSIDEDEKVKVNNVYFENRTGGNGTWFLTEDGLYEVLMQSRKPIAKQFKKEVKKILKELRQTGKVDLIENKIQLISDEKEKQLTRELYKLQETLEVMPNDMFMMVKVENKKNELNNYIQERNLKETIKRLDEVNDRVNEINNKIEKTTVLREGDMTAEVIARKLSIFSTSNKPHNKFAEKMLKVIGHGINPEGNAGYQDKYISINNTTRGGITVPTIMYSKECLEEFKKYIEENGLHIEQPPKYYQRNCKNGNKGDFKSGKIIFDEIEESIKINETTYNLYTNNSEDY